MSSEPTQQVRIALTDEVSPIETLVVGISEYGLAGLTAVDYLADQRSMRQVGHLRGGGPPSIAPFRNGTPRHHTRLYADADESLGVLVGERFVAPPLVEDVAEAVLSTGAELGVSNVTMLTGVPVAHGPEDHVPFYIATEDYQEAFLPETDVRPMGNGFLEGLSAELITRGISDDSLATGVFTTPAHPQAPDAAAAIRLVKALKATHDISVDTGPLEAFADDVEAHYQALAERLEAESSDSMTDDRMYM